MTFCTSRRFVQRHHPFSIDAGHAFDHHRAVTPNRFARKSIGSQCAISGCGEAVKPKSIYCYECAHVMNHGRSPVMPHAEDSDVYRAKFNADVEGDDVEIKTSVCVRCSGTALLGRMYCSDVCRARSKMGEAGMIMVDGVLVRPRVVARQNGVTDGCFYARLKCGWSLVDAATKPPNAKHNTRSRRVDERSSSSV